MIDNTDNKLFIGDVNSSSQGVYFKYDKFINNTRYLVKTGRLIGNKFLPLEPVAECMAYEMAKSLGVCNAEYNLATVDLEYNNTIYKDVLVCRSKWFLEYEDEFNSIKSLYLNIPREELYNKLILDYPNQRLNIDNMIVFDFIINNTDRHLRNFGFINDGVLAPLYDNGLSLGADIEDITFLEENIDDLLLDCDYSKCFCTCNREQLKLIKYHTLNIDNLEKNYISIIDSFSEYLKPYRVEFIKKLVKERLKYVRVL